MHSNAFVGWDKLAELLVQHGADVNAINRNGLSALHLIAGVEYSDEHYALARLLLNYHAKVNLKDADGETPLNVATDGRSKSYFRYFELALNLFLKKIHCICLYHIP